MTSGQRIAKATKQMRDCGFPEEKIIPVMDRLLKSLDFNWDLIEAENYSILVDAIISFEEPQVFPEESFPQRSHADDGEKNANRQTASPEIPLLRKRRPSNQQEQPSGGEIVLKKSKLENDPETSLRSTVKEKDLDLKGPKVRDGSPSDGDGMEATLEGKKLNKNEHAKYPGRHPSSPKLELASSADSKVKLILSWEGIDANFEMPSRNSILKAVEDRMGIHSKNTPPGFSIKKIVTEICQMISESKISNLSTHRLAV